MQNQDYNPTASDVQLTGWHIAKVVDNNDPKTCERVLVRVIGVHNMNEDSIENAVWADRCAYSKFSSGDIPDVGDYLYVQFPDVTNPMRIIWFGWARGIES